MGIEEGFIPKDYREHRIAAASDSEESNSMPGGLSHRMTVQLQDIKGTSNAMGPRSPAKAAATDAAPFGFG
jgi:hypothetical protein